jgi:sulfite exporter TauE/SafE/copper chaperone CopZ
MIQEANTEILDIEGMTCASCERRIENSLKDINGIKSVQANYSKSLVEITYLKNLINLTEIKRIIEEVDYKVVGKGKNANEKVNIYELLGFLIIIVSIYIIINHLGGFTIFNYLPEVREGIGYGMLFIIGLLTSVHCIAMCGGINLSQCMPLKLVDDSKISKFNTLRPSIMYNLGRVISYTLIGGVVGYLGSVISFSGRTQGIIAIIAGLAMVIMGINIINIFPWLRKFNIRIPRIISDRINNNKNNSPLYVGLLNGLMPCGPLQSMQLYALSTADPLTGAISMFFFSLGTVPLMLGLGALSSFLGKKFRNKMMSVSAILVVFLGLIMATNGMALSGINIFSGSESINNESKTKISNGIQTVTTKLSSGEYEPIVVQKGIPVKWIIEAETEDINGCNNKIIIQKFDIEKKLVVGDNIIEFTPLESGNYTFSCWMGMIRSNISVVDNINARSN